ncbi:MAG: hypothetical protein U5P41_12090 [Gammaproteobacteria bacterium]|nr:hypothetical protein [Gammaproteobacteria bacterium]
MGTNNTTGRQLAELHLGKAGLENLDEFSSELGEYVIRHGFSDMYTNEALDQRARRSRQSPRWSHPATSRNWPGTSAVPWRMICLTKRKSVKS